MVLYTLTGLPISSAPRVPTPSWLPVVMARFNPRNAETSAATRTRGAHGTGLVSIDGCFLGGLVLLVTSR